MRGEQRLVRLGEDDLADRSRRLQAGHVGRALVELQAVEPCRDRSRGDDLGARFHDIGNLRDQRRDKLAIDAALLARERGGADLDDDALLRTHAWPPGSDTSPTSSL